MHYRMLVESRIRDTRKERSSKHGKGSEDKKQLIDTLESKMLKDNAYQHQIKQARGMKMNLNQVEGTVKVGTIVQVDLSNVDRQKVEGNDLTLAVAEEEKGKGKYPQNIDQHLKSAN